MEQPLPHSPILVEEWLSFLKERPLNVVVDGTLGAGGHAHAVLTAHPEIKQFVGIDRDLEALSLAKQRLSSFTTQIDFLRGNFSAMKELLQKENITAVDAILLDIGVSSMQFDTADRGFSFRFDGPLDMRMDQRQTTTAAEVVNTWEEQELGWLFKNLGEEERWRRAARAIVEARTKAPITTTAALAQCLEEALPKKKGKAIHPATLVFQALRIYVNGELDALDAVLPQAVDLLAPGGVLGIITFHSLEDRRVKRFFRDQASDHAASLGNGLFIDKVPAVDILTRHAVIPTEEEMRRNPRSRSAKLRVVRKRRIS